MFHGSLVFLQFALAAVLVLSSRWWPVPWWQIGLSMPGVGLAVWAWLTMGLLKLRIHPTTTDQTRLIQHGPYAIVRHPMYTGLLWFTAALTFTSESWWRWCVWLALLAVLVAKAGEEERSMQQRFSEYESYRERVGGLLPNISRLIRGTRDGT